MERYRTRARGTLSHSLGEQDSPIPLMISTALILGPPNDTNASNTLNSTWRKETCGETVENSVSKDQPWD